MQTHHPLPLLPCRRYGLHFVHIVWVDGTLNMVKIQQEKKYGHDYGVDLGRLDYVKFAEAFGAKGVPGWGAWVGCWVVAEGQRQGTFVMGRRIGCAWVWGQVQGIVLRDQHG